MSEPLSDEQVQTKAVAIARTFTSAAPVSERELFAGRADLLVRVLIAASQRQHVAIYGRPGVGKRSLANMVAAELGPAVMHHDPLLLPDRRDGRSADDHREALPHPQVQPAPSGALGDTRTDPSASREALRVLLSVRESAPGVLGRAEIDHGRTLGTEARAHGMNLLPHGANLLPHGANVLPHGANLLPHGANVLPHGANLLPHGANLLPHEANLLPHGANLLPHGANVLPHGANLLPSWNELSDRWSELSRTVARTPETNERILS